MRDEVREISSCDDFELGIKRDNLLEYKVTYPEDKKIQAIVFIIPGFGQDTDGGYMDNLRQYVANEFSVAVVNVMYHCFYSRLNNGAVLEFDDTDIVVLQDVIKKYNIDFSNVKDITKESVLARLVEENIDLKILMTLVPKNNEYQNFGIMQAVDHLMVLKDLKENLFSLDENCKIVCIGSSHGGYIANLIAKIAPNSIDYVIDNSSYTKAPLNYILGKETNVNFPEFRMIEKKVIINCFVQTYWTSVTNSPYYLSEDRLKIRDIADEEHLEVMQKVSKTKTKYIYYHSSKDTLAPLEEKVNLTEHLQKLGFDVTLHVMQAYSDIDGKFIKNLDHGMSMSMKELIKKELPSILKSVTKTEQVKLVDKVQYECKDLIYSFDFEKKEYITLKKTKL